MSSQNPDKPSIQTKIKSFFRKCVRVWHVLRKPTREEVLMVAKVSAIGILIIGLLGFIISILMSYIVPR
ncbi:MAG TPA: protein translocase SEC61 complex subunit gamma, partial [Candidatus Nanoarchaeia archaeon]|nr:protein translocase SEC61 complex subunit gamma [Candidatus Nanoarchaeia archaeon]